MSSHGLRARFYDFVAHYALRRPAHLAAVDLASGRRHSYQELHRRIEAVAHHLFHRCGVRAGDRVAVLAHNSTDILEIQFACWRVGALFVPLNWRLAPPELEYIVGDAMPKVAIVDEALSASASGFGGEVTILTTDGQGGDTAYEAAIQAATQAATQASAQASPQAVQGDAGPERPATDPKLSDVGSLMYTAGTTGRPKGALITHAMTFYNAVNLGVAARVTRDSVHLAALPLFHTGGLNCYANVVFHVGGTNLVMRSFDASEALRLLSDRALGITHFFGVPAHYQFIAQEAGFSEATFGLVNAGVGGAPCPLEMLKQWAAKGVPMQQGYGLTETSPTALVLDTERAQEKLGSAGLPALHTEVTLRDKDGHPVPAGQIGEIWVRGDNVSPGYWQRPDATADSFVDGWLKTGDAARQDADGFFFIVDRYKDMYISGGENVYPAEIEDAIYRLDGVVEVGVVGVPDERWGEVGRAFIVQAPDSALTAAQVIAHCRSVLARFKVPKSVVFIDMLPRNAAGKILKRQLKTECNEDVE